MGAHAQNDELAARKGGAQQDDADRQQDDQ